MPELPEVECLTRAVANAAEGWRVHSAVFYREDLRDPIPVASFKAAFEGQVLKRIHRRSKYMIWETANDCGLFHLGMSGNLLEFPEAAPQRKHTHAIFTLENPAKTKKRFFHFIDPRRFGRINCCAVAELGGHAYFANLGPEPLESADLGKHLFKTSRSRKVPVKNFIMDASVVVGVGNIYASESLYRAKVLPTRSAQGLTAKEYKAVATKIREVLAEAIRAGGTSFRDYTHADGSKGEFEMKLGVYGRSKKPCRTCKTPISEVRLAGRSSFFCAKCQH